MKQNPSLELWFRKRCPGMAQAREVHVSSARAELDLLDEAGEARRVKLDVTRILKLRAALLAAQLPTPASSPGHTAQRCTIELNLIIDGKSQHVTESPTLAVNDPAAWLNVQSIIERFAYGEDAT